MSALTFTCRCTWRGIDCPNLATAEHLRAAADEIERLRRGAACGPADLLPGLVTLVERLAEERRWCDTLAEVLRIVRRDWCPPACEVPVLDSHARRRQREVNP